MFIYHILVILFIFVVTGLVWSAGGQNAIQWTLLITPQGFWAQQDQTVRFSNYTLDTSTVQFGTIPIHTILLKGYGPRLLILFFICFLAHLNTWGLYLHFVHNNLVGTTFALCAYIVSCLALQCAFWLLGELITSTTLWD